MWANHDMHLADADVMTTALMCDLGRHTNASIAAETQGIFLTSLDRIYTSCPQHYNAAHAAEKRKINNVLLLLIDTVNI